MKLQEAKREAMIAQWREMVRSCRSSGETVEAWCRKQGIPTTTYYRRQKQVWEQESQGLPEKVNDVQNMQPVGSMLWEYRLKRCPVNMYPV